MIGAPVPPPPHLTDELRSLPYARLSVPEPYRYGEPSLRLHS
jgi:hypothetical protein